MLESLQVEDWVQIIASFSGAFFAFVFFMIGENWLSKRRLRIELIEELFSIKYHLASLLYYFEMNMLTHASLVKGLKYDGINHQRFLPIPIRESSWRILRNCKVSGSIEMLHVFLKVINNNNDQHNELLKTFSHFAEIATVDNRRDEFRISMVENIENFKVESTKLHALLSKQKIKLTQVIDEVDFTLNYFRYMPIKRLYYYIRIRLNESFREECIAKARDYKAQK